LKDSEYICILEIDNEQELVNLLEAAIEKNVPSASFNEPDFDNSLTAIALAPGQISKKLCSRLKLAMQNE
jgi:hypothetical protein